MLPCECARDNHFPGGFSGDARVMLFILFSISARQFVNETTEILHALLHQRNVTSNPQEKHFIERTVQPGIGCRYRHRTLSIPGNL
jgi:hypothetical protein